MENPDQSPQPTQAPASIPAPMSIKQILFSTEGRINRSKWWLYSILLGVAAQIIILALTAIFMKTTNVAEGVPLVLTLVMLVLYIVFVWISICISAKRCHDSDKSGWYMLIPIYGFILTGFIAGTPGRNQFGEDPLGR